MTRLVLWRRPAVVVAGVAVLALAAWLAANVAAAFARRNIGVSFEFLSHPASFQIADAPIRYEVGDTFARAIAVGLVNTIRVSLLGCVLAVVAGFVLGLARLSENVALRGVVRAAVDLVRGTPLLLLLLASIAALQSLPGPSEAVRIGPGFYLSDRGATVAYPNLRIAHLALLVFLVITTVRALLRGGGRQLMVLALVSLAGGLLLMPPAWNTPTLTAFNFTGGATLSPEFVALLVGLTLHHGAHVSEIVRGAVLAVPAEQREAALALGMRRGQVMRLIVMPQALRAMVPLLANACVSLTKNSSLAVAIGFTDIVSVLNTTSNQTGRAIESMMIMMGVYLSLSLAMAAVLNRYNERLLRPAVRG